MPRKKTYSTPLRSLQDKKLIIKLAKRYKLPMMEITGYLYEQCDKFDMKRAGWEARARASNEKADQERDRYAGLKDSCANMTFAKKNYICVRANLGKPPTIKALSEAIDEANDICEICVEDTRKKLDRDETLEKVQALEIQLKEKSSKKFMIPQCSNGGRLDNDGTAFEGCPRSIGKPVSIEGYCKKLNNGMGCVMFKKRLIAVGTEN